jgi:hypothetical protein
MLAPRALMVDDMPATLYARRLSITTISPGCNVGAKTSSLLGHKHVGIGGTRHCHRGRDAFYAQDSQDGGIRPIGLRHGSDDPFSSGGAPILRLMAKFTADSSTDFNRHTWKAFSLSSTIRARLTVAKEINRRVASGAEHFVFCHARRAWITKISNKQHPYLSRIQW